MNSATAATPVAELFGEVKKNWGWLLALGILMVVLGVIGLGHVTLLTVASVVWFGVLMLIGGVAQLIEAFKAKGWKSVAGHVVIGLLYLLAGLAAVGNPVGASVMLTLMIGAALVGIGIVRVVVAFQMRETKGWVWLLVWGIVTAILGVMIVSKWPVTGLWVIGLFLAIELIANGWSCIMVALAAKRAPEFPAGTATEDKPAASG